MKKIEDAGALFERAIDEHQLSDADAAALMKILRLPLSYFLAAQEAIREGRWRNKENPDGYIHTVAMRKAVKLGLEDPSERFHLIVPRSDDEGKPLTHDSYLDLLQAQGEGPYKSGGVWHEGGAVDVYDEDDFEDGYKISRGEKLLSKLPPEFLARQKEYEALLDSPDPIYFPDWEKIGRAAGLDPEECYVLELRAMGLSRDKAIVGEAPKRKKVIQAAWRRFDRNRCMDRVSAVLNKSL